MCLVLPLLFIVACVVGWRVVRWIAEPIEDLAQARRAPTQFTLADLLILFAALQLAVGSVHYLATGGTPLGSTGMSRDAALGFDAVAALVVVLSWWCGASMVSRAGIQHWWHRAVILAFVVPCGAVSAVVMVGLLMTVVPLIVNGPSEAGTWFLLVACVTAVLLHVCGLLSRWVASKYQNSPPAALPDTREPPPAHSTTTEGK